MDTVKQADPTNWSSLNQEQLVDLASSLNNFFNQAGLLSSQNQHSTGQFSSVVWFYPTPTSHSALFSSINQAGLLCSQNQHSNGQLFSVVLGPPPPPPPPSLLQPGWPTQQSEPTQYWSVQSSFAYTSYSYILSPCPSLTRYMHASTHMPEIVLSLLNSVSVKHQATYFSTALF